MKDDRPIRLKDMPLEFAPDDEKGVVFLFSQFLKRFSLTVEKVTGKYPDCIAYMRENGRDKKIRIEFEYKASNFLKHKHDPKVCDWIVCWDNDWRDAPARLKIVDLKSICGAGFNIWYVPLRKLYSEEIDRYNSSEWSVPRRALKGDLVVFYRGTPQKCIKDIFILTEHAKLKKRPGWKDTPDSMANIRRVCKLASPIFLSDLRNHKVLGTSLIVRSGMQGRHCLSQYWPDLYQQIVERNPSLKRVLFKYSPDRINLGAN